MRRIAVISDVHGNVTALDAVLAAIERERPDGIVVCGDVASGPHPAGTVDRLLALERTHLVRGNADREVLEAFDAGRRFDPTDEQPARRSGAWAAEQLSRRQRDFLAGFRDTVVLPLDRAGEVLFCHGSPGSDEEIITSLTPERALGRMLAGVGQPLVVCGHTHVQFSRVWNGIRVVNTGSVGMPYEGRRGAFWLMLEPEVRFRRTEYDYEVAAERVLTSGYPEAETTRDLILDPQDPREVEAYFETVAADRGER